MIDDGEVRCGACETKLPVKEDVFLCRACMERLPGHLRRAVLNADEEHQYGVRRLALEALGVVLIDESEGNIRKEINKLRGVKGSLGRHDPRLAEITHKIAELEAIYTEARRVNYKKPRARREKRCICTNPFTMKMDGLFGGTKTVCGNCCKPITQQPRRRMA